jgi:hypothetical protein
MNFYEKFPSATREVHIDLNLYRPESDTPVSDWIEYALLIENPEIVVKKRTVENLGFLLGRLPYFESAETEPCEEEEGLRVDFVLKVDTEKVSLPRPACPRNALEASYEMRVCPGEVMILGLSIGFDMGFAVVSLSKAKKATAYDLFTPADGLTLCIPKTGDKVFVRKS